MIKLDIKDLKILSLLQENANLSNREIAEASGLTVTPVYERIKKLGNQKLLKKKVFLLDRKKLKISIMALVSIKLEKHSDADALSFMAAIKRFPEVVECLHITGAFDFQLKVYTVDMDHFHRFNLKKLGAIKNIKHMESYFVMNEVVNTTAIPLFQNHK